MNHSSSRGMLRVLCTTSHRSLCSFRGGGPAPVGRRAAQASALRVLGLSESYSLRQLRDAYFESAKQCHPDSSSEDCSGSFLQLTEAYEHLRSQAASNHKSAEQLYDTPSEEMEYRASCLAWLGLEVPNTVPLTFS